jgi:cyanophycin synthetase
VVAVTGTNGKTTTSRMIGYIAQRAGWSAGWSSTDGTVQILASGPDG